MLTRPGIGPVTAAQLLSTAGDNPDRLGSEAAFATLRGVSPVEQCIMDDRQQSARGGRYGAADSAIPRRADRIAVIDHGKLIAQGAAGVALSTDLASDAFDRYRTLSILPAAPRWGDAQRRRAIRTRLHGGGRTRPRARIPPRRQRLRPGCCGAARRLQHQPVLALDDAGAGHEVARCRTRRHPGAASPAVAVEQRAAPTCDQDPEWSSPAGATNLSGKGFATSADPS
ncbi:transposase [Hamadaea flava]